MHLVLMEELKTMLLRPADGPRVLLGVEGGRRAASKRAGVDAILRLRWTRVGCLNGNVGTCSATRSGNGQKV